MASRRIQTRFASFKASLLPLKPCLAISTARSRARSRSLIDGINRELAELVLHSDDVLLDVAGIAETVGLANWHDMRLWNMAKFSFSDELIPLYADHVARVVAALRGKSGKVLVLDLDNTVWGGIIGDDGLEGIKIAQGDAIGEAHLAVQRMALDLRQRGIVLAVSSKNSDEVARAPFEQHPEMLLKLEHIAVFQANWNDKATNIQAIAEELSLGLDSIVFLDDNPAERGLVRKLLPQVAVPELPEDPSAYARTLAAGGYFEAVTMAAEDLKRASFYQDNAKRASLQRQAGGVDAYLASLDMTITFQPFDGKGRARIVQLINKSNQYNLTTRRYTEPEILEVERDPKSLHPAGTSGRHLRRQRHDQRRDLQARGESDMGDRYLADELPGARTQSRAHGSSRDSRARARRRHSQADRYLSADRAQSASC